MMTTHSRRKPPADSVLGAMMARHWAILPESLATMVSIAERTNLDVEALEKQRGEPLKNTYDVSVRDGIATLNATGPMFRYASFFSRVSGATAYEDLATDFNAALEDPRVKAIIWGIDSPGGEVNGNDELAQMVYAARGVKPMIAYVSHLGASAAYWLASAADEVVTSPTSILGSIGTVATLRRSDKADRTIEIVSTQSPKKRVDPETDDGRAEVLKTVDALAQVFVERVATYRGTTPERVLSDFGQGGVFVGQAAVDAGLADRIGSYESVFAELRDRVAAKPGVYTVPRPSGPRASTPITERNMDPKNPSAAGASAPAPDGGAAAPVPNVPAAAPAAASAAATTTVVDLDAIRAEAAKNERARIAGISALRKAGNEKMIDACLEDSACSVADAKARLYDHERAIAAGTLDALQADERNTPAPKTAPTPSTTGDQTARAAGAAAVAYHRSITSTPRKA